MQPIHIVLLNLFISYTFGSLKIAQRVYSLAAGGENELEVSYHQINEGGAKVPMEKASKYFFFKFVLAGEVIHIGSRIVFYAILHCWPGAFDLVYENKEGFVHFTNLTNPKDFITPKPGKGSMEFWPWRQHK